MSRTTIDLDNELVAEAMRRHNLATTKREAVDFALRREVVAAVVTQFRQRAALR